MAGKAKINSADAMNQLTLFLPIQVAGLTVFENEGAYNIWDTDYDTYTLIYSCKEISKNIFWKGKNGIELKNIKFRFFIF